MTRNSRRRFAVVMAAASALLMLVSACGSSDSSSSNPSGDEAPAGDAIPIGIICDCTGPFSSNYLFEGDAADAWAQATNAAGGINGHQVKMYQKDAAGDPTKALQYVKELVEQNKIIALIDMSTTSSAWEEYITDAGVPVVGGNTSEAPFSTNPNFFADGATLNTILAGAVIEMQKEGLSKWGVMYCAEAPACAQQVDVATAAAKVEPAVTVTGQKVAATQPNFTAQCVAFQDDDVDAIFLAVPAEQGLRIINDCDKIGYTPKSVTVAPVTGASWLADPLVEGAIITTPNASFAESSIPAVKDFQDAINKYYPDIVDQPQYGNSTMTPWIAGQLFAAAAKAGNISPTSTGEDVKKGLFALKDETLGGLIGPVTFANENTPPAFPTCYFFISIADGKWTSPDGGDAKCLTPKQLSAIG
jgi:branched-chain amino acid transport system substrate-binding protein